jgi:hypothetical protein
MRALSDIQFEKKTKILVRCFMTSIVRQNVWMQFTFPLPLVLRQNVMYFLYYSTIYIIDALFFVKFFFFLLDSYVCVIFLKKTVDLYWYLL